MPKKNDNVLDGEVGQTTLRQVLLGPGEAPQAKARDVVRGHMRAAWAQTVTLQEHPHGEGFRCTVVTGPDKATAVAALRRAAELIENGECAELPFG